MPESVWWEMHWDSEEDGKKIVEVSECEGVAYRLGGYPPYHQFVRGESVR